MTFNPTAPNPSGLWRRVPPAVFPPIMGLFSLGFAWRSAAGGLPVPVAAGEMILGAVTLLFAFAFVVYAAKILRRPGAISEEIRSLPGRAGIGGLVLSVYLAAMALAPHAAGLARAVFFAGIGIHAAVIVLLIFFFATGPREQRRVTPVWHLNFVGIIVAALAATALEYYFLALIVLGASAVLAAAIWAVSLEQMVKETVPAPLRPLLMIHLSPVAFIGLVSSALELDAIAMGSAGVAGMILLWAATRLRWLTEAGFSPFWSAFTFPLGATATLWLTLGGMWCWPGIAALAVTSLLIPWIAYRIGRLWASGELAVRTNAVAA